MTTGTIKFFDFGKGSGFVPPSLKGSPSVIPISQTDYGALRSLVDSRNATGRRITGTGGDSPAAEPCFVS